MKSNKSYKVEPFVRDTICVMIMASMGSHEEGERRSRQVYVIKDAYGPLVTDAYVGVCCKSLQKLCAKVKACMLRNTQMRDTTFDGLVSSNYSEYIDSPGVCERIADAQWDPPTNVVVRWIEICMEEAWKPANRLRAICLFPLRLDASSSVLEDLQAYLGGV